MHSMAAWLASSDSFPGVAPFGLFLKFREYATHGDGTKDCAAKELYVQYRGVLRQTRRGVKRRGNW